jgi:ribosomal protein S18 acetylase RimI-like enzyme
MLVRAAEPEDAMAVAWVHVRSWQAAYRGLIPDEYLDGLRSEDRAQRYDFGDPDPQKPKTFVAVDGAEVWGFATISPSRDADLPGHGELCGLYADPACWGRGVGLTLMREARERLRERGFAGALLWVLDGNVRAERFYERDGWRADGQRRIADVWGMELPEVRMVQGLR